MSLSYLDIKYINLVSSKLDRFKWKSGNLCVFRCPFCGDSKKDKNKTRGYIYEKEGGYTYHCHNCSITLPIGNVLKHLDPRLYSEYILEKYKKESGPKPPDRILSSVGKPKVKMKINLHDCSHLGAIKARYYLNSRKIPKEFYSRLFYTEFYKNFVDELIPDHGKELPQDSRIVIPCYHFDGTLIGVTARSLEPEAKIRYIISKVNDDYHMIYGLDRFERKKQGYVVEGPIDSMCLPNALAACGSNIKEISIYIDPDITTFILDNEPRNKDIVSQMRKVISKKLCIFIWPENIYFKDINAWIMGDFTTQEIVDIINKNTFRGLEAEFRLNQWKKI